MSDIVFMPHLDDWVHVPTMTRLRRAMEFHRRALTQGFSHQSDVFGSVATRDEYNHALAIKCFAVGRELFLEKMRGHIEQRFMRVD